MKVWLDDLRTMPSSYDLHARTAQEAITALETGEVTEISLDYELGTTETGGTVAAWIEQAAQQGTLARLIWRLHTSSPLGRRRMNHSMTNADRYWDMREKTQE
ncbi:hypothetical protein Pan216_30660 [Planctomycetes bacterium Pan216]|uniref:Cyclic-phosphate processing Receiver domain-containing protein n=1 Tax=Kolteria novifilia TaxID=2527975 RepID=A0A518B5G3_9BACT|nr:hypothetical protein Pan216_30660 [Planctomycetes bacterium Pan216]